MTNEETKDAGQLMVELTHLRAENAKLREFAEELAYACTEHGGKDYVTLHVDPALRDEARAFFQAEKETENDE